MKVHVAKFFLCLLLLVGITLVAQELLPQQNLSLLPRAVNFLPGFLNKTEQKSPPQVPAEPLFLNRDKGLAHFYRRLAQLRAGRVNRVRVMHFGDSVIWYERVGRDLRAGLTRDFGDGGRGQIYMHQDRAVTLFGHENLTKEGFDFLTIPYEHFNHLEPKWLPAVGFTGWTYRPLSPRSESVQRAPPAAAPFTRLSLIVRDTTLTPLQVQVTNLEKQPHEPRAYAIPLKKETCIAHELEFEPTRHLALRFDRPALIDAAMLETAKGVSYSTFIQKGKHMAWMTAITPENFNCGYRAAHPDLLVFQYGINESASIDWKAKGFTLELYRKQLKEFFSRLKAALPEVDVLIIGPYERLKKTGNGFENYRAHDDVRAAQKAVAQEFGFAYFDAYAALGGAGHLERMLKVGLAYDDHAHLTDQGSELLGKKIYAEIYAGFTGKQPGAPIVTAEAVSTEANQSVADATRSVAGATPSVAEATQSPILFNSLAFAYFFLIVFAVAAILNRVPFARLVFLTLASWYFYASWRWWALGLMLFSTGIDYYAALKIDADNQTSGKRKLWLLISLVSNLGLLFFFKYFDFFATLANPFLAKGNFFQIPVLQLVLPVGISFYTFQSLSYTIDVFRRHIAAEKSFWRFAFFVSFFPQLVAGPIVRATEFLPQMMQSIRHFFINKEDFGASVYLFSTGLFKKTLADWISVNYADRIFADPGSFTAVETLIGVYAFGIQIYLDFSSYTDMAIAAARLMGFNLTINFDRPYVARTITEFWRRWHISLSTWLRDYLYISLGGNRRRLYLNLFLTMLLGGLWHGAGINFALWGLFHGIVLIIERATGYAKSAEFFRYWKPFSILITFHLVMFSWIFFRCHDLTTFIALIESLCSATFTAPNVDLKILAAVGLPYLWQFTAEKFHFLAGFLFANMPAPAQAVAAWLVAIGCYRIFTAEAKAFIYFQF